jgi:hypothetical protein
MAWFGCFSGQTQRRLNSLVDRSEQWLCVLPLAFRDNPEHIVGKRALKQAGVTI